MSESERQRVVKVPGSRRAQLTAAPGATEEPEPVNDDAEDAEAPPSGGPNDERMRQDKPPHY